jgi:ATP-dependent RNA helicase DHX37/DHR1
MFAGQSPSSDQMSILSAIGAYLNESQKPDTLDQFCKDHFLRPKAMDEVVKLMQQLTHLAKTNLKLKMQFSRKLLPPTSKQENLIRQVLLSGYVDCVARLDETQHFGKMQIPVYQTIWSTVKEQFVIHPSSCVHRQRPAPKWIVFDQVQSKQQIMGPDGVVISLRESNDGIDRKWVKGLTVIKDTWLTIYDLTNKGSILEQPEPRYNPKTDKCSGFCSPTFGPKMWSLPLTEMELINPVDSAACFARALLEAKVPMVQNVNQSIFAILNPFLISKPTVLLKSWAKNQSRVQALLNQLVQSQIFSKAKLLKLWESNPAFLAKEVAMWLPIEFQKPVIDHWPPVQLINSIVKPNIKLIEAVKNILPKR